MFCVPSRFIARLAGILGVVLALAAGVREARAHEVYGVVVRNPGGQMLMSNFMGFTDYGGLQAFLTQSPVLHVNWLEADGFELDLFGATGHQLVVSVADTTVLGVQTFGPQFDMRFTGRAPGHTTIRLGFEYFGLPEFTSVDLDVDVFATNGVGPQAGSPEVRLSAVTNPARSFARVSYATGRVGPHRFEVVDLQGRVRQSLQVQVGTPGPHELSLDVAGLDPGLYFLRLAGERASYTRKFAVTR